MPPTTLDRLKADAQDWAEVFYGVIPLAHLRPIFIEAYREHKPGSVFEAAEILQAWYKRRAGQTSVGVIFSEKCPLCRSHNQGENERPCPFHQTDDRPTCSRCGVPHDALPIENKDFFNQCEVCQRWTIPKEGVIQSKILQPPDLCRTCGVPKSTVGPGPEPAEFLHLVKCPECNRMTLSQKKAEEL